MKAHELRIGNLLLDRGDKVLRLDYWDFMKPAQRMFVEGLEVHPLTEDLEYCQPILLTEEWLLKFGFMQYIDFGVKMGTYDKIPLCGFTYSIHTKKVMIMHKGNSISHWLDVEIKYVHQLQNLYFALTGEELTYGGNK
jgi:hypothetical protein